jgi:tetratricopeptide (TPR) repeat protein
MNDSLDKALDYQQQAALVFNELNDNRNVAYVEQSIGAIYSKMGKYPEAIEHLNQSLELTKRFNLGFEILKINYEALSEVYEKKGNFQEALKYYKLFSMLRMFAEPGKNEADYQPGKTIRNCQKEAEIQQLQSEKECRS